MASAIIIGNNFRCILIGTGRHWVRHTVHFMLPRPDIDNRAISRAETFFTIVILLPSLCYPFQTL